MGWLKRGPDRVERLLAGHDRAEKNRILTEAIGQAETAAPIPAGTLIATRTGDVAHIRSALDPGACCEAMSKWEDWRIVGSDENLRNCHRCEMATERRAAS